MRGNNDCSIQIQPFAERTRAFVRNNNQIRRTPLDSLAQAYGLLTSEFDYQRNLRIEPEDYPAVLQTWFERVTGDELDLENPITFNQKIQWLKLFDSTREKGVLADKYLVRDYVSDRIGSSHLVPLLGVWENPDDIDFDLLPERFVLKATHGCGWNIIVKEKSNLNVREVKRKLRNWLKRDYSMMAGLELQYRYCQPRVIAEKYLENENGDLFDYKFFCFGGNVESIMFLKERSSGLKMAFFDKEWRKLPYVYSCPRIEEEVPKPSFLREALQYAETLAQGFPHVRVDFYISHSGVRFGEMTFTTMSGVCKWSPKEQDLAFGKLIDLTVLPKWKELHRTSI